MAIQALRTVVPLAKKDAIVFSVPVTALVVAPGPNQIAIGNILAAGDLHRFLEVQARTRECVQFLREKNFFDGTAVDIAVRVPLNGTKAGITFTTTFTEIVTGDVYITLDALLRDPGAKNWVINAYSQTLDFMNEKDRLTA